MTRKALSNFANARTAQVDDLQAENAVLRRQLKEARDVMVPAAYASAAASLGVAEELRMENCCLLKTVAVLEEEITTLRHKQRSMEEIRQEMNGRMMFLIDNIDILKNQVSAERQKCVDAEDRRCAQRDIFFKLFMQVKNDMDQSTGQQASAVMKDNKAPLGESFRSTVKRHVKTRNAAALNMFAEDKKLKVKMAPTHGMKTLSQFRLDGRRNRKPINTSELTFTLHLDVWS